MVYERVAVPDTLVSSGTLRRWLSKPSQSKPRKLQGSMGSGTVHHSIPVAVNTYPTEDELPLPPTTHPAADFVPPLLPVPRNIHANPSSSRKMLFGSALLTNGRWIIYIIETRKCSP